MSLRAQIIEYISNQTQVSLTDLYTTFAHVSNTTVRGRVNEATKDQLLIRIARGIYILASDDIDAMVIHGNSLELVPELIGAGVKYDMVFLDIPYNLGGQKGGNRNLANYNLIEPDVFEQLLQHIVAGLKNQHSQVYFMIAGGRASYTKALKYIQAFDSTGLKLIAQGQYTKLTSTGKLCNMGKYDMPPELIMVYSLNGCLVKPTIQLDFNLQRPPLPKSGGYPTEKPEQLLSSIIEQSTYPNDLILDPFGGSGKSLKCALALNRRMHIMDISENSVNNYIKPILQEYTNYEHN